MHLDSMASKIISCIWVLCFLRLFHAFFFMALQDYFNHFILSQVSIGKQKFAGNHLAIRKLAVTFLPEVRVGLEPTVIVVR